jgi:hypothetical protein
MKTPDFFALSDREQEERRPDGAQHTESKPIIEKDCKLVPHRSNIAP